MDRYTLYKKHSNETNYMEGAKQRCTPPILKWTGDQQMQYAKNQHLYGTQNMNKRHKKGQKTPHERNRGIDQILSNI